MGIVQPVDKVQIAGAAAVGADGEIAGHMRFCACRECRDLHMRRVAQFDIAALARRLGDPIQAVAGEASGS